MYILLYHTKIASIDVVGDKICCKNWHHVWWVGFREQCYIVKSEVTDSNKK